MYFVCDSIATILVATLFICHVSVLAAPVAEADLETPDSLTSHVIKVRSAEVQEEEEEEEDDDDDEDEEDDDDYDEDEDDSETETVAKIRVVWSADEDDLYVDNALQTARMWGILQGCEGEDYINIKESDDPPSSESTIYIPFETPPTPQEPLPEISPDNTVLQDLINQRLRSINNPDSQFLLLRHLAGGNNEDQKSIVHESSDVHEHVKNSLFGVKSYADMTEETETTPSTPATVALREGETRKLWAKGPVDYIVKTTPDYNRLLMVREFGSMFGVRQ